MMRMSQLKLKVHMDLDRDLVYGYVEDLTTGKPYIFDSRLELFECLREAVGLSGMSQHPCEAQSELPVLTHEPGTIHSTDLLE